MEHAIIMNVIFIAVFKEVRMQIISFLTVLGVCLGSFAYAAGDNLSGGSLNNSPQSTMLDPISDLTIGGDILWDLSHGVYLGYEPANRFSSLTILLGNLNYTIETTYSGLDNINLSNYDIVVVCIGSAWHSSYQPEEAAAVEAFVENGGGVLIMGENIHCPNGNINSIAQLFGSTCGISNLYPEDLHISEFSEHPIFNDINQIYFLSVGKIDVEPPSELIAFTDGFGAVAAAEVQSGKVVVLGDMNCWENNCILQFDNQLFAENTFIWLTYLPTDVNESGVDVPGNFIILQNYPNPFNARTTIEYILPADLFVKLEIYNLYGQNITVLVNGNQSFGKNRIMWEATGMASGLYFCRLRVGGMTSTKMMTLLK